MDLLVRRVLLLVTVLCLLQGCAITRPPKYAVDCEKSLNALGEPDSQVIRVAAQAHASRRVAMAAVKSDLESQAQALAPANILVLSSGGENGAYGAGYLVSWIDEKRDVKNGPPFALADADLITGVSAGAILANFAFIGKGLIKDPDGKVGTAVWQANQLFTTLSDQGTFGGHSYWRLITDSGFYETQKKRDLLASWITDDFIIAIDDASGRDPNDDKRPARKLYVGFLDLDYDRYYKVDLTDWAKQFAEAKRNHDDTRAEQIKACYRAAVDASSAIPMAFEPQFINGVMLVDGGTRWPLFLVSSLDGANPFKAREPASPLAPAEPPAQVVVFVHDTVGVLDPPTQGSYTSADIARRSLSVLEDNSMQASIRLLDDQAAQANIAKPRYLYAGWSMLQCQSETEVACADSVGFCRAMENCLSRLGATAEAQPGGSLIPACQFLPVALQGSPDKKQLTPEDVVALKSKAFDQREQARRCSTQ
jgi:predicted acylesterase/phospholipase RssA